MYNSIAITSNSIYGSDSAMQMRLSAVTLFVNVLNRSKRALFLHKLLGKQNQLPVLTKGENSTASLQKPVHKTTTVSLDKIVGSESRVQDFDKDFRPLASHIRDRWVGIAVAVRQGIPLPPVELVQHGDVYYVRDGHHRISVAKTFGRASIEARIV